MSLATIYSTIFFISFSVYVLLGLYIFSMNARYALNRIFLVLCLSLCLWSFGFSIANSADSLERALFWRRISALGWGTAYSILLHYFIRLTGIYQVFKKKLIYVLIYIPAGLMAYAYGFGGIARDNYNLVYTTAGWVNRSVANMWDKLFIAYYIGYTILTFVLLVIWSRRSKERSNRIQAYVLLVSFFISVLIGTFTDKILNTFSSSVVPQLGPVIILIPTTAIFYCIERYGLMMPIKAEQDNEPGRILNDTYQNKIYNIISVAFITGSLLNVLSMYFIQGNALPRIMFFSGGLFVFGCIIIILPKLINNRKLMEWLFLIIISLAIPVITLNFSGNAGVTVWAMSFIFMILSIIYNRRIIMVAIAFSIIITQIIAWIHTPEIDVHISSSDYIVRLAIIFVALLVTYSINRIYIHRLQENEEQIKYQKIILQISSEFVHANESNMDEKIDIMLKLIGESYGLDRTNFYSFNEGAIIHTHEWCAKEIDKSENPYHELPADIYMWWIDTIRNGEMVCLTGLNNISIMEKKLLECLNINSMIAIPAKSKGEIVGFLSFSTKKDVNWKKDQKDLLRILANILADSITKIEAEKEIKFMAYYDPLTGLPNKLLFRNRLEKAIYMADRTEKMIGVIFLDLDSFKSINDTMGHEVGDELLKLIAFRLSGSIRQQDTVSRYAGDKYLIELIYTKRLSDIQKIVDKVMRLFNQPLIIGDQEFFITVSAGVAVYPADGNNADELIKNAELAMYISKEKGKNQYTFCSPDMKEDIIKQMQLTNNLYRALERNELVLYYQPQIDVLTKNIIGFEALIRWKHPELGMVSPVKFIPLAEKTGLINSIGEWVLHTACLKNKEWQEKGLGYHRMAVNLSIEQCRNPNLVEMVAKTLRDTGLDPQYLELEITEGTAVKETEYISKILNELKKLGVSIAIDDFGIEYSSLSRLETLPIDRIKMAMQFVQGLTKGGKDEDIAKIILQLAKNLKLYVIAEGVETQNQYDFLHEHKCDEIQGYYFYKPMPAHELEDILKGK